MKALISAFTVSAFLVFLFFLLLFSLFFPIKSSSQTSFNMHQIAHMNPHPFSAGNSIGCWGYVQNGREYGIFACNGGTSFIDITDSAAISEVDFLPGQFSNWRDFKIYQHWIYIVNDVGNGMQIADLQYLPDSVHLVATYSFGTFSRAHTMQQSGPYLFLNGGNYSNMGVFVLDITNPTQPLKRGEWEAQYVHDERIVNDTLYACNIYVGTITVIDATNKDSLRTITSWTNGAGPMPHNCALTDDRKYLFATDEILNPVGRLKVWNIENIFNPVYITTWYPAGGDSSNVHNIEIYDTLAVISHYTAGLRVLNIADPEHPVEIGWFDTYPQNNGNTWDGCKGNYMMPSGKILANDKQSGFYILGFGSPPIGIQPNGSAALSYSLKQNYPNPFNPVTNIEFTIPKNSNVSLKIYDISGKETVTLIDGNIKGGANKITYDASGLASGIYFYTLKAEDFTETKKMILIK